MQRFIREVNTTSRACVLWDLEEETDYIVQVQSIGLYGESQASKRVHFRTLKKSDRFPSNSSNQGTVQSPQTGSKHFQRFKFIFQETFLRRSAIKYSSYIENGGK